MFGWFLPLVGWVKERNPTLNDFIDWKCRVSPSVQPRQMPKSAFGVDSLRELRSCNSPLKLSTLQLQ